MSFTTDLKDLLANQNNAASGIVTRAVDYTESLSKTFNTGRKKGESTGITSLDSHLSFRKGFVYCFTGYPQSGKSAFLNYLAVLQAKNNGRKTIMYSPEAQPYEELIDDLIQMYLDKNVDKRYNDQCSEEEYERGKVFINDHFYFVAFKELPRIVDLLSTYEFYIKNHGVEICITDPFNYVAEGSQDSGYGFSQYLKTALSRMKSFATENNILNLIVEHPKQPILNKNGSIPRVSAYSLYGGSMWFNKMDCIVAVHRDNNCIEVEIEVIKMKQQRLNGIPGITRLRYDLLTGRYHISTAK